MDTVSLAALVSQIAEDPAILGLGDLVLCKQEQAGPRVGLPSLLLEDPGSRRRYAITLQPGPTDESQIIRAIENWGIEHRRAPQYRHSAVLIAGDIPDRFINVLGLLNSAIPFIAIKMKLVNVGGHSGIVYTTEMEDSSRLSV